MTSNIITAPAYILQTYWEDMQLKLFSHTIHIVHLGLPLDEIIPDLSEVGEVRQGLGFLVRILWESPLLDFSAVVLQNL